MTRKFWRGLISKHNHSQNISLIYSMHILIFFAGRLVSDSAPWKGFQWLPTLEPAFFFLKVKSMVNWWNICSFFVSMCFDCFWRVVLQFFSRWIFGCFRWRMALRKLAGSMIHEFNLCVILATEDPRTSMEISNIFLGFRVEVPGQSQ